MGAEQDRSEARLLEEITRLRDRVSELESLAAEERVTRQAEFLKHVLESLTHPIYVLDARDYTIRMANRAAAPGGIPPNTTCHALTHRRPAPCQGVYHVCPVKAVQETGKPVTVEHVHFDADGNARDVEVHAYPILDEEGKVAQVIEYTLDITDRKRMEAELRQGAERMKWFAYSVSHDLRSPLVGIHGLTRLLHQQYRDLLGEQGQKHCDQILQSSEHALLLIEEINSFIRTREYVPRFERADPREILRTVRSEFGALLGTRQIRWVEPETVPEIQADRLHIQRVFRNLVDNALKYGGEQLSEIGIGYSDTEDFHIFSVADDGVGIPQEQIDKIFGLFERAETSAGVEGTGLGLAIVKEIVEKHRGRVWVEAGNPKGVKFRFSISKSL